MTDLKTLQKVQQALVSGLVSTYLIDSDEGRKREQEIEEALNLLRPIIVKEMFKN